MNFTLKPLLRVLRPAPVTTATLALVCVWGVALPAQAPSDPAPAGQPPATRPRIGLALGGGAARGLAHIGVLRWLDEHRIPVDMVTGTSMGGLIGGSFATGMSPDDIQQMVAHLNWAELLAPDAPFKDLVFRRKQDTRAFPSQLEFGLRGGFTLPQGLSTGQQVDLLLGRIAMPYYAITSFDQLPTPFRCVATDLKKSEMVEFSSGPLARALRATMAIPGVFAPVTVGDRVLVDGGLLNNVPADVAARMGATVVIAVDVGSDLTNEKRSDSLFSVLGESLDVMMRVSTNRALESASIVLVPKLKGFVLTDFDRVTELVKAGYDAADSRRAALEPYALSPADYKAFLDARAGRRRTSLPTPAFIEVEGAGTEDTAGIRARLEPFLQKPLDTAAIDEQLVALMGTKRYVSANYRLVTDGTLTGILVTVRPKTNGPPFLLVSLDLENNRSTGVAATVRGRIVLADLTGHGSEARMDVAIGSTLRSAGEWYQPVGHTGLFVAPHGGIEQRQFNVFADGDYRAEYRQNTFDAGIDAGFTTGNHAEFRVGYAAEHLDGRTLIGDPVLPEVDGTQRYFQVQATYDGQTGPTLPDRGLFARGLLRRFTQTAAATWPGSGSAANDPATLLSGEADASVFHPVGTAGRVFVHVAGGSSFGSTVSVNQFSLGGPFRLGALNIDELRGSNYLLATAGYFHRVYRFAQGAAGGLHVGAWVESGSVFEKFASASFTTNISGGAIVETPLGPILAGASVGLDGRYRFYAGIGPILHR